MSGEIGEGLSCALRYTVIGIHPPPPPPADKRGSRKAQLSVEACFRRVWLLSCFGLFVPSVKQEIRTFYEIGRLRPPQTEENENGRKEFNLTKLATLGNWGSGGAVSPDENETLLAC